MALASAWRRCVAAAMLQVLCCSAARIALTVSCPADVVVNVKGDCVDGDSNKVDPSCCATYEKCREEINELMPPYEAEMESFMLGCALEESDLIKGENGWEVADDVHVCTDECVPDGLNESLDGRGKEVIETCGDFAQMEVDLNMISIVRAISTHRMAKCPPAPTTTPSVTTTPKPDPGHACLEVKGAGIEAFNTLYKVTDKRPRGKPQYQSVSSKHQEVIEWSRGRRAWRIYWNNWLGFDRGSYYIRKDWESDVPPESGWQATPRYSWVGGNHGEDLGDPPTIEYVECPAWLDILDPEKRPFS